VRVKSQKASDWYTARRFAEKIYGFNVLVERNRPHPGAHLSGRTSRGDQRFALAIRKG